MTKTGTLVTFVLDRTGSMQAIKDETIGGFNGYIEEIRKGKGKKKILFSLIQFDTISVDLVYDAVTIESVEPLTTETYVPRAGTPLYDAVGGAIKSAEEKAKALSIKNVLITILTDGQENSSSEWTGKTVNDAIKEKEKQGWAFAYIGLGREAWDAVHRMAAGTISMDNIMQSSAKNVSRGLSAVADSTLNYASTGAQIDFYKEEDKRKYENDV